MNELRFIAKELGIFLPKHPTDILDEAAQLGKLVQEYVDTIFITLGARGIIIVRKGNGNESLLANSVDSEVKVRYYKTDEVKQLVNVSGAGDCLASGIITGMLFGYPENICVSVGFAAAQMALQCRHTVPAKMFDMSHTSWTQKAEYIEL